MKKIIVALALVVSFPLAALAHNATHNHSYVPHAFKTDSSVTAHRAIVECLWNVRAEIHEHYVRQNSSAPWIYSHDATAASKVDFSC